MKMLILLLVFVHSVTRLSGQEKSPSTLSKEEYLDKSKKQKRAAWILLGAGLGMAATGFIIQQMHDSNRQSAFDFDFTGAWIAAGGGALATASIPLFIGAAKNKKAAGSISLTRLAISIPSGNSWVHKKQPALAFRVSL